MHVARLFAFAGALLGAALLPGTAAAQKHLTKNGVDPYAKPSPNARRLPPPKPVDVPTAYEADKVKLAQLDSAMWPQIEEAKKTLKEVHRRWNKSLPKGSQLFVTVRVYDDKGNFEHVLVRVDKWVPNRLFGVVSSVLATTQKYQPGQQMNFEETIVVDWRILSADGQTEGDYVSKFLDEYYQAQTGKQPTTSIGVNK